MTITLAWHRVLNSGNELVIASDSRLRSHGSLDQAQKIFTLERGDCALAFCGDAQIAYPLFVQVATALNNNIKTRSRAEDVTKLKDNLCVIANQLIGSWDLSRDEIREAVTDTAILLSGYSWRMNRYYSRYLVWEDDKFVAKDLPSPLEYPWGERQRSFVFLGDYRHEYFEVLYEVLEERHGAPQSNSPRLLFDFDYEPLEALERLLTKSDRCPDLFRIGGHPQVVKVYVYGQCLPFAVTSRDGSSSLLGRKFLDWEKTERPILDLRKSPPAITYPMESIPRTSVMYPGEEEK